MKKQTPKPKTLKLGNVVFIEEPDDDWDALQILGVQPPKSAKEPKPDAKEPDANK